MENNNLEQLPEFTIEHHAIMFALFAKYADKLCGEKGLEAIASAVAVYGKERGKRMAKRALRDGLPLTMQNYLAYSEWQAKPGQMDTRIVEKTPTQITHIHRCEWCASWKKHDLMQYGRYYCDSVDINLVKGFNPQNDLQVDQVLSNGAEYCVFHWLGYNATPENEAVFNDTKLRLGSSCVRDFRYHTSHLYAAISRVLRQELKQEGDKIIALTCAEFKKKFSDKAMAEVLKLEMSDFDTIDF